MPRQLERVPAGTKFDFELVYNVETENGEVGEDLNNVFELLSILEDDFLGGHGSRGYGRIRFENPVVRAKKIEYYSAPPEDRDQYCAETSGKSIDECKAGLNNILALFS
jgi:CRISPR-associated protein Csm3